VMGAALGSELIVLLVLVTLAAFSLIVSRPQFGAYLYLMTSPLIVGIARGDVFPVVRPNEFIAILFIGALALRSVFAMLTRVNLQARVGRVDLAFVLLALTSSVVPLLLRNFRGLAVSTDDLLYPVALWKYLLIYWAFRLSISTPSQVTRCLCLSMASAALVGVIGILQVEDLFGIPVFLHRYYDQPFEGHTTLVTERATSTVASAFGLADLMIMNLVIAMTLLRFKQSGRWILWGASALFFSGCIAAGEFSGIIGMGIAMLVFAVISGRLSRVLAVSVPAFLVAGAVFLPVISKRLAGFQEGSGLPPSWHGRWNNLSDYFLPVLFSNFNWLLGVRPAARLPAHETWRQWVYIESGYIWLLWIGGIPLLVAFIFFAGASGRHLWQIARERSDAIGVTATAGFAYLIALLILMFLDPHLTLRGSADLFFPLLALSFVSSRGCEETLEFLIVDPGEQAIPPAAP
jgi:hypothetical protein